MWFQEKENGEIHIVASARGITSCQGLLESLEESKYKRVTKADVSFNSLKSLRGLEALSSLRSLDIRCNNVSSLRDLLPVLQRCDELRHVRMKECGRFAKDPKVYAQDVCREVPGLQTVDGIKNAYMLSEQQQRAQRFLNRVFGIGPNQIADLDLNGKEICGEDFACVLRALSHLPVIRLQMQNNPASQIRGYRCYVVSMVKSLKILDGRPVTSDERVNATREISQVTKEVASVQLEVDKQRVIQTMLGRSPSTSVSFSYPKSATSMYRDIYENSSFVIEELNAEDYERQKRCTGHSADPVTPGQDFRALTPSTSNSSLAPRKLSFSEVSKPPQSQPRTGTKGKINLMLVASKPLREDIVEFLEDDETGAPLVKNLDMPEIFRGLENAPIQAISGRIWSKLEILVNYLQIYRLIFRFSIPWPAIWFGLNNESDITTWIFHYVPSLLFQGKQKSNKTNLAIFLVFLFLPILLLGVFFASVVDRIVPQKVDNIILKISGYSWKMLRKRAALFGMTVSYLPLANSMLSMLIPTRSEGGAIVIKGLPYTPWPNHISEFVLSEHWPMIVAFVAGLVYIIGIPCVWSLLIRKGSREASAAHAVDEVGKQIIDLRQDLYMAREKGEATSSYEAEMEDLIIERERAYDLLYAKAVREYHKPQTFLFEDYHEVAKYWKIVIMVWKIVMLINVLGLGALAFTMSAKFIPVQTTCGLVFVGTMLVTSCVKRPFQASSENMLEIVLIGANLMNASIGFLLSIVAQARSDEIVHDLFNSDEVSGNVTGGILIIVNALAVCFAIGVIVATPWLNRLSRNEIKRLKDYNIQHAVRQLQSQASTQVPEKGTSSARATSSNAKSRLGSAQGSELKQRRPRKTPSSRQGSKACTPTFDPNNLHEEMHNMARACNSMPCNSRESKKSQGSSKKQPLKKSKSIIMQLFDGNYSSPFYKRLQRLRNASPNSAGGQGLDEHMAPNSVNRESSGKSPLPYASP
ncbi:hypothetical protein HOP50_10g58800 [Chloropicon primus]|uniref:Leucine-rich repeat domain-containing protein n=1 Tax=Chloropicon primus TaxID=1764295 RepID=A0A5B8MV21_9CHLO|nr:hypothetical protein A3770_10p58600 [Chloropicon primus]UPR02554.1 hypothetical protein HOP50_10g58800 [Chloropicon primus]|mmetsp:Transcript_3348/g.9353  ORF Transcript_3348/g.9353 Transcript_3348/m.9353 type:complete len:980 (+) Transcript_3348:338-3277(+)|eukprot:QDZ23342.1 hypothetical protein A3770_10p58600 [Chloropicon primus]